MSTVINAGIILDQAFEGEITVNPKTGDRWVNLSALQGPHIYQNEKKNTTELKVAIGERKAVSDYGETHTVALAQSKQQKGQPKTYVGGAKAFVFTQDAQAAAPASQPASNPASQVPGEGLPF
jgi:hypothetical protein